jgi:uncharacterized repeat protein (TIGR01451 family)
MKSRTTADLFARYFRSRGAHLTLPLATALVLVLILWVTLTSASAASLSTVLAQASNVCFATHNDGSTVFSSTDSQAVRDAVATALTGGTVKIAGTCAGTVLDGGTTQLVRITKSLTLAGGYTNTNWITPSSAQTTTLDAAHSGRVIQSTAALTVQDLTIQNGQTTANGAAGNGAGINASQALTLSRVNLYNNATTGVSASGGGTYVVGAANIIGTSFVSNTSSSSGGGVFVNSTASITGTSFLSNTAGFRGGGAYVVGAASVTSTNFLSNTASSSGGGAFANSTASITGTSFLSNTSFRGGGAYVNNTASITGTSFVSNTAGSSHGGGAFVNSTASITGTSFVSNTASSSGGGAYVQSTAVIIGTSFLSNTAGSSHGGGAAILGAAVITGTSFVSNTADSYGGGAAILGAASIIGTSFVSNTASSYGGGAAILDAASIIGTSFISNTASSSGGGAWIRGSTSSASQVINTLFAQNRSNINQGSALYMAGSGGINNRLTLLHTTVATPFPQNGAAIYVLNGTVGITNTIFANQAIAIERVDGVVNEDFNLFDNVTKPFSGTVAARTNSITGTAAFVDAANGDYQLMALSEAINAGTDAGITSDFFGDVRPQQGVPDIGFDESPFTPLTPDLVIVKNVQPATAQPGSPITYTLSFTNIGSRTAPGALINDNVPLSVTIANAVATADSAVIITQTSAGPNFAWTVNHLPVGASGVIKLTGTVSNLLSADGIIANTATITTSRDITPSNNLSTAATTVIMPRVQFSAGSYSVAEADDSVVVTLTLDVANPNAAVNVLVQSSNGAATAGTDYTTVNEIVNVPAGSTQATFTVPVNNDAVDENSESFTLTLSNPTGGALSTTTTATITILDDDTAGVTVSPTSGLTTTEEGGTANVTVVLNSEPTGTVTVTLVSSDATEGTASPAQLTFNAGNWDTAQTVTVTGGSDDVDDDDIAYTIVTTVTSADVLYNGIAAADVSVTNTDDDTAGVTVDPTSSLITTEAGGSDSFTVVLDSEPTGTVTVTLTSSDSSGGTVSPTELVFDNINWDTAQTVTVTGGNDDVDDDDIAYTIVTKVISSDSLYNNITADDVGVTNTDDDTAGVTVDPASGLVTTEAGDTASFTVVLDSEPTGTVTVTVASSDTGEGTVSPAQLTFNAGNWDTAQTVTVTGVNDDVDDGDIAYTIDTTVTSADILYNGISAADVSVTNTDDDTAAITVDPISGLLTSEAGESDSFTVVLNSEPTGTVTVAVASSDATEVTVSPTELVFDKTNWSSAQMVIVTGEDDNIDDGDVSYTIVTTVSSSDTNYNGIVAADVSVSNIDDDTAAVIVDPISGLLTSEAGESDSFIVTLDAQPTGTVTITVASSNTGEGTVSPAQLIFNAGNWTSVQIVTVTGVDDDVDDGDVSYAIVTSVSSDDAGYNGIAVDDVSVANIDDDRAGITANPANGLTAPSTGDSVTFALVLDSEPTGTVTVTLAGSDGDEGTVSPTKLVFDVGNWNTGQTVTVTRIADRIGAGFTIFINVSSDDPNYDGLTVAGVNVTNPDNANAGVTVSPTSGLVTTEAGGTDSFSVVLESEPTGTVTVTLSSSDSSEGSAGPMQLVFDAGNWYMPQTVTVTGADDDLDDGDIAYTIVTTVASVDVLYNGIPAADVSVSNTDDDDKPVVNAGVTVSPTSGLTTTEAGGTARFTVVLDFAPTAAVTVTLAGSDSSEGSVSPTQLFFNAANWNTAQMVTVTGEDDNIDDGDVSYTIVTTVSSGDTNYNGIVAADVSVSNIDDDTAAVIVDPISGLLTSEAGESDSFIVTLDAQPTGTVTITFASSNTGEGTVSPAQLIFNAGNWTSVQIVTITGVDDDVDDGDVSYAIVTSVSSDDAGYNGIAVDDVSVANIDDDRAGITANPANGLTAPSTGDSVTFALVLDSEPTGTVTVTLAGSDGDEGTVSPMQLVFDAGDWNTAQTVTVTRIADRIGAGFTIFINVSSDDPNYDGLTVAGVSVTNPDNDNAGVTVSPTTLSASELGATAAYSVVLNSEPTAAVTVNVNADAQTTATPTQLVFTTENWFVPQLVSAGAIEDAVAEGPHSGTISHTAGSADAKYNGITIAAVTVNITDRPNLSIAKRVEPAGAVARGSVLTYTVTLSNPSEFAAQSVFLTDTLPAQVSFVDFVQSSGATAGGGLVTWNGDVAAGDVLTIVYTVLHNGGYGETFNNSATFRYGVAQGSAGAETRILGAPVLSIAKTADVAVIDEGGMVNYTVVVRNQGESAATGVSVEDDIAGVLADNVTLAAGAVVTYTYTITTDNGPQTIRNTATATSDQTPTVTANVSVTVNNVAPGVTAGAAQTVTLGAPVTVTATFTDPGSADTHTATVNWNDGGEIGAATVQGSTVRAVHVYTETDVYAVTLCVSDDDGGEGCSVLSVVVEDDPTGVGNPPTLSTPGNQQNNVGDSVTLAILAQDADGDVLSFSAEGLPAGLSIDSAGGVISGSPTTAGDYQVTVHVSDGKESRSISFVWRVLPRGESEHKLFMPTVSKP